MSELQRLLGARGHKVEWEQVKQDLEALQETEVRLGQQWYLLRGALRGVAGKVLQAAEVAPPPAVRREHSVVPINFPLPLRPCITTFPSAHCRSRVGATHDGRQTVGRPCTADYSALSGKPREG